MRKYSFKINSKAIKVEVLEMTSEVAEVEVNGKSYSVNIERISHGRNPGVAKTARPLSSSAPVPAASASSTAASGGSGSVCAPIPGAITAIFVKNGDKVKMGQPLFKMEAMKMENEINSRVDGSVVAINISIGDSVTQGQELILIAPAQILKNRRDTDRSKDHGDL